MNNNMSRVAASAFGGKNNFTKFIYSAAFGASLLSALLLGQPITVLAQDYANATIALSAGQYTTGVAGEFTVEINNPNAPVDASRITYTLSIAPASIADIKSLELSNNGTWSPVVLTASGASVSGSVGSGSGISFSNAQKVLNFRASFNTAKTYILAFTMADNSTQPANVLTSSALPVSVVAGSGKVLGASTFVFSKNLRLGMKNSDVTELQTRLTAQGLYSGSMNGYFDSLTFSAVKGYQTRNGIIHTGFVGPLTRGALNSGK